MTEVKPPPSPAPSWLKSGVLNTVEHVLTRVMDAATSLLLIAWLSPESFSALALAQAWVAPVLLFLLCPETALYRDFERWRAEGTLGRHLAVFRRFAYGKFPVCLVIAFLLSWLTVPAGHPYLGLGVSLWAVFLMIGPQWSGPDREFLRISLKLKRLNQLTLFQKGTLLGLTVLSLLIWGAVPSKALFLALGASAGISAAATALWAYLSAREAQREAGIPAEGVATAEVWPILRRVIGSFSLWQHLSGVIWGWVQTMDIFILGALGLPAREIGLYASTLKLANFSQALPLAIGNYFSIWLGRNTQVPPARERLEVRRFTWLFFALGIGQVAAFAIASPWVLRLLSRGRWELTEQAVMRSWLICMVIGSALLTLSLPLNTWLVLRRSAQEFFWRTSFVWIFAAIFIYTLAIRLFGPLLGTDGGFTGAAYGNIAVGGVYSLLVLAMLVGPRTAGGAR
ncbi:MAG: lipopolysaccharide biosynthesis protein [Bacteriovoracia bacterium]